MQLSLIPRNYDQSWLVNFLKTIKDRFLTMGSYDLSFQEEIRQDILQEVDLQKIAETTPESARALEEITIIRENLSKILVKKILFDYFKALTAKGILLDDDLKVAFDFYGTGILVWVEPSEANKNLDEALTEIEIEINKKYSEQQLEMKTIVFDKSYGFDFPPQYV